MIDENIVYVKIKNGIFKCYKSEQMHKPIYYPVESKTNGYIDYNDVIDTLSADDLYNELKKQKETIDKIYKKCQTKENKQMCVKLNDEWHALVLKEEILDILKENLNEKI